ncbi:hypothetical protein KSP40_PGU012128 [Platanthera guangdongensis]|uniref:Uncharacterized protein n=1 Tax=Platanthera guangdongensis TaxID=2320717 RepID=A0ABR2LUX4_9ASPA
MTLEPSVSRSAQSRRLPQASPTPDPPPKPFSDHSLLPPLRAPVGIPFPSLAVEVPDSTLTGFGVRSSLRILGNSEIRSSVRPKRSHLELKWETSPSLLSSGYASSLILLIFDAYKVLSSPERESRYSRRRTLRRKVLKKKSGHCSVMYTYKSPVAISKPDEVVEWLEWYKHVIHDIVTRKKVATGFGYFDELESELYSAIHFAYHGPVIDSMNMLPNSFEAEERSLPETSEVLHLVSGRSLFGIICTIDKVPELSHPYSEKLSPFETSEDGAFDYCCKEMMPVNTRLPGEECFEELKVVTNRNHTDAYSNMELHISGKLVATATRSPNGKLKDSPIPDNEDHINVFLNLNGNTYTNLADPQNSNAIGSKILLGTIIGLGNNAEGICSSVTHEDDIPLDAQPPAKMQDLQEDKIPTYECRCTRARLPSSKFWLFEPRSYMHDIGGWYVETFGQNKMGRTVLSRRQWGGVNVHPEKRLHPAIYLLALAYKTLDFEDNKRRKVSVREILKPKVQNLLRWCKRLL